MKKIITVVIAFVVLFCFNIAMAKGKKEVIDNSPLIPFNIYTEKLSPNFAGTDIVKLYSSLLAKAPLKKEEFETTADYEKKIIAAVTDDVYAFKLIENGLYGLNISHYDADTQKVRIDIKTDILSKYMFEDFRSMIILKFIDESYQSHIGSNAFGASVKVTTSRGKQYGIALVNQKAFGTYNKIFNQTAYENQRTINIEISMPPDIAKKMKDNIGVLLLCKPRLYKSYVKRNYPGNDLIFENGYYLEATLDSPTEVFYDRKFINVEALSIWVYDIRNGEIILKKDL